MSSQNNLNNLFSSGLFQNTPNEDQQKTNQNVFGNTSFPSTQLQSNTNPFQNTTNTFPSNPLQNAPLQNTSNPFQNATPSNPFGQTSTAPYTLPSSTNTYTGVTSTPSTQFGNTNQTSSWSTNTSLGNIFGQQSSSLGLKNGTKDKQYEPQKIKEERGFGFLEYNHINFMKEYSDKSSDELRYEDYNLGRRPNSASSTSFSNNVIGNTGQSTSTSIFGSSQQVPVKPDLSIFGQTSSSTAFTLPSAQPSQSNISTPSLPPLVNVSTNLFGNTTQPVNNTPLTGSNNPFANSPLTSNQVTNNQNSTNTLLTSSNNPFANQPDNSLMTNTSFQPSFLFNNANTSTTSPFTMTQTQPQFNYQNSSMASSIMPSVNQSMMPPINQSMTSHMTSSMNPLTMNPSLSCADVDKSDPYGIKGMKFKFIEKELSPYQRLLAEPIHKEKTISKIDKGLDFRPPEKENAYDVYFTPSLHEIRGMKKISNLIMTFPGKGQIEYLEPVDVSEINVQNVTKKVLFTKDHVFVTDRPGKGLNLAARVFIDKIYPFCKSENKVIIGRASNYPEKGIQDRFVYTLKKNLLKEFVDYDFNKGTYVYKVQHF